MKKILYLFVSLLLVACSGSDGGGNSPVGGNEFLNVSNVDVTGDKTTATLSIQASPNCDWTVDADQEWISNIAPASGRGSRDVTITLSGVNPSTSTPRKATLTVRNSSGSITRYVTLTQAANGEYIEISGDATLSFASQAESHEVAIRSNTHWTVSITGNTQWISVAPTEGDHDGRIIVSVADNPTGDVRTALLTIKGTQGATKELTVKQGVAAAPIVTLPIVSNITGNSATITLSYSSDLLVTFCGICYDTTSETPNVTQHSVAPSTDVNSPVVLLKGLAQATTYYIRAYVITTLGETYSETTSFSTTSARWPNEDDIVTPN